MQVLDKDYILQNLTELKKVYEKEGFIIKGLFGSYSTGEANQDSDVDILVEATPKFALKYGFKAISRIKKIQLEIGEVLNTKVDLADVTGMGKTAKRFIIDRAIYV